MRRLLIPLFLLAVLLGGGYAYLQNRPVDDPLTGQSVSRDVADRRPVAVILDNFSPDARPQAGLDRAALVFETLAEGGITRFLAVYSGQDAPMVGPVRSARLYFNSWVAGAGAIFGHDGGNVDALQELRSLSTIYNIDADRSRGPFWRITQRLAPHNEYTSTAGLRAFAQSHGGNVTGVQMHLPHQADAPLTGRPAHLTLSINFSSPEYNVQWQYDRTGNQYLRSLGGSPQVEASTGRQLTAKNVVVMYTPETPASDPFTPGAIHLDTEGTGRATLYRDGATIEGHWSKNAVDAPLQWLDAAGHPLPLDRGATWVEVVPTGTSVAVSS